jgi:hypothetical protein
MEVKGTAVIPIRNYVQKTNPDRYKDWLDALSPESRKCIEWCLAGEWYPITAAFIEPTEALCRVVHGGDEGSAWTLGRYSADYALSGVYRIFARFGAPHFLLNRASQVFSQYYRPSRIAVTDKQDRACTVQIQEFETPHRLVELRIGGWMERAVELSGRRVLRAEITRSMARGEPVTEYVIQWE